jgi:hypothetical protein
MVSSCGSQTTVRNSQQQNNRKDARKPIGCKVDAIVVEGFLVRLLGPTLRYASKLSKLLFKVLPLSSLTATYLKSSSLAGGQVQHPSLS